MKYVNKSSQQFLDSMKVNDIFVKGDNNYPMKMYSFHFHWDKIAEILDHDEFINYISTIFTPKLKKSYTLINAKTYEDIKIL